MNDGLSTRARLLLGVLAIAALLVVGVATFWAVRANVVPEPCGCSIEPAPSPSPSVG